MDEPNQLNRIEKKLDLLLSIHSTRTRKPRQRLISDDRPREMMRVFEGLCTLPDFKKEMQKFPHGTYHNGKLRGHTEVVPRSILINRASMRGAFKPDREEIAHKSAAAIAGEVLDTLVAEGSLIEMTLDKTKLSSASKVNCIFSPRWAAIATNQIPDKGVVDVVETEEDSEAQNKPQKHSGMVWTPPAPETPLESPNTTQETLSDESDVSEEELIREMREAEQADMLGDDVVFERSTEKERRKL